MNVWIINHYAIPPSMGGLVRHYYFSKFLRQMGHTVRIFTASEIHNTNINMIRDSSLYKEQEMDGVPYTFLKTRDYSGNGLSRIYNMLEFPLRIQRGAPRRYLYLGAHHLCGSLCSGGSAPSQGALRGGGA